MFSRPVRHCRIFINWVYLSQRGVNLLEMNTEAGAVWLVDDDEDDLMLIEAAFNSIAPDIRVTMLQDGEELLPHLQQTTVAPSLIVLDLNMHRSSGLRTLELMREIEQYRRLPVVVLTTSSNPADRRVSASLGADEYYVKPNNFNELTGLVSQLVQRWIANPNAS